jgi:predicted Zn-dependent protease
MFRGNILPANHPAAVTVERVGSRIANASRNFAAQNPSTSLAPAPYTYTVVRSDQANAFVLPNNHVFVLTGLFKYVKDEVSGTDFFVCALDSV